MFLGKRFKGLIVFALVLIGAGNVVQASCTMDTVTVRDGKTKIKFSVEIANTDNERANGLMFRESMPNKNGMLFVFDQSGPVSFWMRNTIIPLDMLFIDDHGVITKIHPNAIPYDETPIHGGQNVKMVLEINAGLAKRYRIDVGAQVQHPLVQPTPMWPCE